MAIRLINWQHEHAAELAVIANNYNIARFMRNRFPYPYNYDNAVEFINYIQSNYQNHVFAVEADGYIVGSVGLFPGEDIYSYTCEIGYWIGEEYWGRGIASYALFLLIEHCFSTFNYNKLKAHVFHPNLASMRVLEKCGFHKEAILKQSVYKFDEFLDEHVFAIFNTNTAPKY